MREVPPFSGYPAEVRLSRLKAPKNAFFAALEGVSFEEIGALSRVAEVATFSLVFGAVAYVCIGIPSSRTQTGVRGDQVGISSLIQRVNFEAPRT